MRHFLTNLLRVIFVLSTIVIVTDCCSSRILLVRERTLRIAQTLEDHLQPSLIGLPPGELNDTSIEELMDLNGAPLELNLFNVSDDEPPPSSADELTTPTAIMYEDELLIMASNETYLEDEVEAATTEEIVLREAEEDTTSKAAVETTTLEQSTETSSESSPDAKVRQDEISSPPPPLIELENVNATTANATDAADTATVSAAGKVPPQHKISILDIYSSILGGIINLDCTGQYLTDFCLNGGRCFRIPIGNHSFFSCECADGYVGERCESKSYNGHFVPLTAALAAKKPKIQTARIVFSYPMLVVLSAVYITFGAMVVFRRPRKPPQAAGMPEEELTAD